MIGTAIFTPFYDMFWLFKYLIYGGVVAGFFYAPSDVFDTNGKQNIKQLLFFIIIILFLFVTY